ncbi:hypothetical protein P0082_11035 [Candidatus Haliotispira prima]|uniref:Lipoprotein n=1 Tax=Candidatus Haliotispira prima TaxID=3034016 RepID=A0ABY8MGG9_9SPIO|nr:hypothetical protein P0082_11035 [Candidatus Haliotispira prima]
MKKLLSISMSVMLLAIVLASCSTLDQHVRPNYKIVDHKGVLAGARVPTLIRDAMTQAAEELSRKHFPDSYVFVASQKGRNLDGLMMWANNFSVQAEVAKRIQTSVNFTAENSVSGNKDSIQTTMDIVTEIVSEQNISGLRMQQDWWIKLQYEDEKEEYQYVAVYVIEKSLLDKFMNEAIERAAAQQELDEEDTATIAKLSDDLSAAGYGLEESKGELSEAIFDSDNTEAEAIFDSGDES